MIVSLVVVWTAVLVPPWLRGLREGRPGDSISSFHKQLRVLERGAYESMPAYRRPAAPQRAMSDAGRVGYVSNGRGPIAMGPSMARVDYNVSRRPIGPSASVRMRRRQVLAALVAAVFLTGSMALSAGTGMLVILFGVSVVALAGYVALLAQMQRSATAFRSSSRYRSAA